MSTWISGKDLMKRHCQTRKWSTVIWQRKILGMLITNLQNRNLGKCQNTKFTWASSSKLADWYITTGRCIGKKISKWTDVYELDPAYFLSVPKLAWQACLKKTEVKLKLLTDVDGCKWFRMFRTIHHYTKANKQYIKEYDKELIYLTYWDVIGMYVTKVADLWF